MALEIKNDELFNQIVSDAIESAITKSSTEKIAKRWTNAIDRAVAEIQENPYLHYDSEAGHLVILSSSSNKLYAANGTCQCFAYLNGSFPCWHRAAARIWRLYLEAENKPLPPAKAAAVVAGASLHDRLVEQSNAPLLRPASNYKPTKIGNIRF